MSLVTPVSPSTIRAESTMRSPESVEEQAGYEEDNRQREIDWRKQLASLSAQAKLKGVGATPASQMQEAAASAFNLPGVGASYPHIAAGYTSASSQGASVAESGSPSSVAAAEEEPAQ